MAALIIGRELGGVVFLFVQQAERNKPPIDLIACLGRDLGDPAGGDPGKGTHRVPEEFDVIVVAHICPFCGMPTCDQIGVHTLLRTPAQAYVRGASCWTAATISAGLSRCVESASTHTVIIFP